MSSSFRPRPAGAFSTCTCPGSSHLQNWPGLWLKAGFLCWTDGQSRRLWPTLSALGPLEVVSQDSLEQGLRVQPSLVSLLARCAEGGPGRAGSSDRGCSHTPLTSLPSSGGEVTQQGTVTPVTANSSRDVHTACPAHVTGWQETALCSRPRGFQWHWETRLLSSCCFPFNTKRRALGPLPCGQRGRGPRGTRWTWQGWSC